MNSKPLSALPALAATLAVAAAGVPAHARAQPSAPSVVLIVADGLGTTMQEAARLVDGRLAVDDMPASALVRTSSADSVVTDSAAGATAMATGVKTANKRVGTDTEGKPLQSVAELAKRRGMAVGLVTTSYVLDATPAAFSAHQKVRYDTDNIARDLLRFGPDLVYGGGEAYFLPSGRQGRYGVGVRRDTRDMREAFAEAGYHLPTQPTIGPLPQLGLFGRKDLAKEPTLAHMTRTALANLTATGKPFFLLVEEEGTDTLAHANDVHGTLAAVRAWNEAVRIVLDYRTQHPDTVVLVTADHESGGARLLESAECDDATSPGLWQRLFRRQRTTGAAVLTDTGNRRFCLRFVTNAHTAAPVALYAAGVTIPRAVVENTDIYQLLRASIEGTQRP